MMEGIWESKVRNYEVDYQGIVNNANYFHYLDHARANLFKKLNVSVNELAKKNINAVLMKTEINFKKALKADDEYVVRTSVSRESRFKIKFIQTIMLKNNPETICVTAESIVASIDASGRPVVIKEFDGLL